MTYSQKQISHTINFIVDILKYNDKKEGPVAPTHAQKSWINKEIQAAIDPL